MVALMAEPSFIKNWASWLMNVLAEAPSKVTNGINKILFNPSNAILISKCTVKKLSSLVLTYHDLLITLMKKITNSSHNKK